MLQWYEYKFILLENSQKWLSKYTIIKSSLIEQGHWSNSRFLWYYSLSLYSRWKYPKRKTIFCHLFVRVTWYPFTLLLPRYLMTSLSPSCKFDFGLINQSGFKILQCIFIGLIYYKSRLKKYETLNFCPVFPVGLHFHDSKRPQSSSDKE